MIDEKDLDIISTTVQHKIEQHLLERGDERYVLQRDCDKTTKRVYQNLADEDKRIDILVVQQKINNWLTLAIAGGIITLVIKVFLGG